MNISSILLLGTENILALAVIRALGTVMPDVQIHTYSPSIHRRSISERSRYVKSSKYFNSWENEAFEELLKNRIKETKADIVLPISDNATRTLITIKEEIGKVTHLPPLAGLEIYDRLESKDLLPDLLTELGFPQAKSWVLHSGSNAHHPEYTFPLLLKPIEGSSGLGIQKAASRKELEQLLNSVDRRQYILQEFVRGQDIGCSVLAIDGEIKACTIQKVLLNKGFGVATAIKFIDEDAIYDTTERLIRETGYSGVAHLDYRIDERDHQPRLLDFNARFWFSLLGSKAAGINFAVLACKAALGMPIEEQHYRHITYFLGSTTLRYYARKMIDFQVPIEATRSVYTDLWDRLGDPMPEFARYLKRKFQLPKLGG